MGCEPTQAIRHFTLASRATRLPCVLSMLPSISFGTRVWVLAGFAGRPLKSNAKSGPNRNGRGSPKLRLRAILSPALARRRVYEVRSAPANPFDNTEKSVPVRAVSLVRNGDNGGGNATAVEPSPAFKYVLLQRDALWAALLLGARRRSSQIPLDRSPCRPTILFRSVSRLPEQKDCALPSAGLDRDLLR